VQRQVQAVVEEKEQAVLLVELAESDPQVEAVQGPFLVPGPGEVEVRQLDHGAPAPSVVHSGPVQDDLEEPGPGSARLSELSHLAPSTQSCLLDGILRFLPVAEDCECHVVGRLDQGTYELLEEGPSFHGDGAVGPGLRSAVHGPVTGRQETVTYLTSGGALQVSGKKAAAIAAPADGKVIGQTPSQTLRGTVRSILEHATNLAKMKLVVLIEASVFIGGVEPTAHLSAS
jgi:hypothetical protein